MSQNKNAVPKKISANLLEKNLADNLRNIGNVRTKDEKIKMDDLSPNIINRINSWGAPAGSSYNDSELRSRISTLESNQIKKDYVFNKQTNKVTFELLDGNLSGLINSIPSLVNRINSLEQNKLNSADLHREKIQIEHLADDVKHKIDAAYSHYLASLPSGDMSGLSSAADLIEAVKSLRTTKADKTELANYRRTDAKIGVSDMETQAAKAINNIVSISNVIDSKADKVTLNEYRRKAEKIRQQDLAPDVENVIQRSKEMIQDVNRAIDIAVENRMDSIRGNLAKIELGDRYLLMDKNITYAPDMTASGDHTGMPFRRQVVHVAGKDAAGHPAHDTYNVIDIFNWIVRAVTGVQYDTQLISADNQRKICNYAASKNPDYKVHHSFGDNKPYYGVIEKGFTLTECISYLLDENGKLQNRINGLENRINSLETRLAKIEAKVP